MWRWIACDYVNGEIKMFDKKLQLLKSSERGREGLFAFHPCWSFRSLQSHLHWTEPIHQTLDDKNKGAPSFLVGAQWQFSGLPSSLLGGRVTEECDKPVMGYHSIFLLLLQTRNNIFLCYSEIDYPFQLICPLSSFMHALAAMYVIFLLFTAFGGGSTYFIYLSSGRSLVQHEKFSIEISQSIDQLVSYIKFIPCLSCITVVRVSMLWCSLKHGLSVSAVFQCSSVHTGLSASYLCSS